jgi:spore germination cell wall hydrolase CwlJ-like protein
LFGTAFKLRLFCAPALLLLLPSLTPPQPVMGFTASLSAKIASARAGARLAGLPQPEPLIFAPMAEDKARLINAAIPFAPSIGAMPRPFAFAGSAESKDRAVDCLASAMWYEAGGDVRGQRAVAQVVLNRVRHPAFPASICGVVFQGSERQTGCQFTFTCDGAMQRTPSDMAFARARGEARAMIEGAIDREVGLATHYHTDWVHPVWSTEMDKLARVDTHLFFRWRGNWGGAQAMRQAYSGNEPAIPALARLSPMHRNAEQPEGQPGPDGGPPLAGSPAFTAAFVTPPAPASLAPSTGQASALRLDVSLSANAGAPAMAALGMCDARAYCKVVGYGPDGAVTFLYVRDRRTGVERTFWDCAHFPRKNSSQCLDAANGAWINFDGNLHSAKPRQQEGTSS